MKRATGKTKRLSLTACVVVGLIVASVLILKCAFEEERSPHGPNAVRPVSFPNVLIPPASPKSIHYSAPSTEKRAPDTYSLSFRMDEAYPAENVRNHVRETLSSQGWQRLGFQLLATTVRAGWEVRSTCTQDAEIRRWQEGWVNSRGEYVCVILDYEVSKAKPVDSDQLDVNMTFFGRDSGIACLLDQYQKSHPEEFHATGNSINE